MPFISNFPSWIYIRHYWPTVRSWYMPSVIYSESFVKCWFKRMGRLRPFLSNSSVHVTGNFTGVDSNTGWLSPLSFWKGSQKRIYLKPQNIFSVDCLQFIVLYLSLLFLSFMTRGLTFSRLAWNASGECPWTLDTHPCPPLTSWDNRHASPGLNFCHRDIKSRAIPVRQ